MAQLPLSDVVNVSVQFENGVKSNIDFSALLLIGNVQNVIPAQMGIKKYTSLDDVGADFGVTDPEYKAAQVYFSQSPSPNTLYIGTQNQGETPAQALQRLWGFGNWYGVAFTAELSDADALAVAGIVEASGVNAPRILLLTTSEASVLDAGSKSDIASQLAAAKYSRTIVQYSSTTPCAAVSIFALLANVNYNLANATLTIKFKEEPGVTPEQITSAQADILLAKRANAYVTYSGDNAILQEGVTSGDLYIDERVNIDWLANAIQLSIFSMFKRNGKTPMTDGGIGLIHNAAVSALSQATSNGILAQNAVWQGNPIGTISTGAVLPDGYYVYVQPISSMTSQMRMQRKAIMQIAAVLAGAFHHVDVVINVER